jgi:hypothetical protein
MNGIELRRFVFKVVAGIFPSIISFPMSYLFLDDTLMGTCFSVDHWIPQFPTLTKLFLMNHVASELLIDYE